jgi:glycosyltransferase involved in cell wall biosynthesis
VQINLGTSNGVILDDDVVQESKQGMVTSKLHDSSVVSQVHIAWTAFQRRQESMRDIVGFDCWYFPMPKSGRIVKIINYARLFAISLYRMRQATPDTVWVQLPQIPALWAALAYRALSAKPVKIIADCHNAQFRKPWSHFPFALWSLKRADVILVHNEALLSQAKIIGWPINKVLVLEDVPAMGKDKPPTGIAATHISAPKPWVVFPGSFAADEPIREVLEAARIAADYTFIITGRLEKAKQNGHDIDDLPENVILPGFLSVELFDDLLREADVVIGLTREEGIQLSVCNEALGFGRPLVTSNTKILRKLFGTAAVLVDTKNPASIAAGCRTAVKDSNGYVTKSRNFAVKRLFEWRENQLSKLLCLVRTNTPISSNTSKKDWQ